MNVSCDFASAISTWLGAKQGDLAGAVQVMSDAGNTLAAIALVFMVVLIAHQVTLMVSAGT